MLDPMTATTSRGPALLREVADYIGAHPDEYDQSTYGRRTPCGSAFCIAGTAVYLVAPDALVWAPADEEGGDRGVYSTLDAAAVPADLRRTFHAVTIDEAARQALGLTSEEADQLFDGDWLPVGIGNHSSSEEHIALVVDALYRVAAGATIDSVTDHG